MNYAISRSPITGYGTRDSTIASARAIGIYTTTEMGPATAQQLNPPLLNQLLHQQHNQLIIRDALR
jgi:hypothetical protein